MRWNALLPVLMLSTVPAWLPAQAGRNSTYIHNVPYDGRFTYARIKYDAVAGLTGGGFGGFRRGYDPMWNHDFQTSDLHFPKILEVLTSMHVRTDGSNVFTTDDPQLFKFPMAYLCEVGHWQPSEAEVLGLRKYLLKGGFILVDDFGRYDWDNFETQMKRVLPKAQFIRLTTSHPLYDSFFHITSLDFPENYRGVGEFYGIFEDNDPTKRLMMMVDYNFDVSEFWEFSATGRFAIDESNDAYKLGVNYLIYTLTH